MKKVVIGVDIAKNNFHVCFKVREGAENVSKVKGSTSFDNNEKGFDEFLMWVYKRDIKNASVQFVMEATGIYFEDLAYFLYSKGHDVCVVLANKIKSYAKSLNVKTKTDKVDSKVIAEFGMERKLVVWKPMSPQYKILRDSCRELLSLKKDLARAKCQIHAYAHAHGKAGKIIDLKIEQIVFYEKAIKELEKYIVDQVEEDPELKERIRKVQTVPGLGFITIVILVCETNGFTLFTNIRQLVSYAGLDVVLNESGNFKGRSKISKRGNSRIRQALYMPSMSAVQANKPIKALYQRICEKNPKIKRKGIVAGMRKLLNLAYTLWKKNEEYDKDYQWA